MVARLVEIYPGIEEFYFLNQKGQLGYITGASPHLVKETFSERKAEGFLKRYADFKQGVRAFQPFLTDLYESYPSTPQMELGYVVPPDGSKCWKTATLVLHEHILSVMRESVKQAAKEKTITVDEADRKLDALTIERGIYHGLDDLFNHVSTIGGQPFFPTFCYNPMFEGPGPEQTAPLRVINLKYVNPESVTAFNTAKFEAVYSQLRSKLTARGALNPSKRAQSRLTVVGE